MPKISLAKNYRAAAAAGGSAVEVSDWDSRPTSATDGDVLLYTPTNVVYIWSDSFGDWVRDFLYGYTGVLDTEVDGSSATLPTGWTETTGASATVTSDGTWLTMDDTPGPDSEQAYWEYIHGKTSLNHLVAGYGRVDTGPTNSLIRGTSTVQIADNVSLYLLLLEKSSVDAYIILSDYGGSEEGITFVNIDGGSARYFEFMLLGSDVWCYIDHSATPTLYAAKSSFQALSSFKLYRLGSTTAADKGKTSYRDVKFWHFS